MSRRDLLICPMMMMAAATLARIAAADDEVKKLEVPGHEYVIDGEEGERRPGLDWRLATGATLTFNDNRSVVGQSDGSTLLFGFKLDALASYNDGPHEWRNMVTLGAGLARTPLIDELVKSRDALDAESIYLHHALPWFGPYVRLAMGTALFRGADVRPEVVTYQIAAADGSTASLTGSRLTTTDPLRPMTLKQSVGPFLRPLVRDAVNLEIRAGLGARETLAAGQIAITDDAATDGVVEARELADVFQVGAEVAAQVWGAVSGKRVLYRLTLEAMTPFAHSELPAGDRRGAFALTSIGIAGALSFNLVDWASVDYELRVVRDPQLLDEVQVQHGLVLTFGLAAGNFLEEEEPPCKP